MVAGCEYVLQGICDGCCARCYCQTGHASLKHGYSLLEYTLGGVGKAAVDVAGIAQAEAVGCMLRIAEHIRGGLIDGHGASVGCWVGLFLAYVKL